MDDFDWNMLSSYQQPQHDLPPAYAPILKEPMRMKQLRTALAKEFYRKFDPPQAEAEQSYQEPYYQPAPQAYPQQYQPEMAYGQEEMPYPM